MKKIKAIRMSGYPILTEDAEAFRNEWREVYDKAAEKCQVNPGHEQPVLDPVRLSKLLNRVERILQKKYNTIGEWNFLTTQKAWKETMDKYGNIMVTRHAETGEMLYVIMDLEEQSQAGL